MRRDDSRRGGIGGRKGSGSRADRKNRRYHGEKGGKTMEKHYREGS